MADASTTNDTAIPQSDATQATRSSQALDRDLRDLDDALEAAGIYVDVDVRDNSLILSGEVDSAEMRQAAFDLGGVIAQRHGLRLEDAIEVLDIEIDTATGELADLGPATIQPNEMMAGVMRDVGTIDPSVSMDEAVPYFPPTDPVIGEQLIEEDEVEVIGGFQPTAIDNDDDVDPRHLADDERISDDVRKELREDGTTTDLRIAVETRNRVVILRGEVSALEDSDNAEAVAGRVAGVEDVRNELDVIGPIGDRRTP
jgi:osmotically-inducible protein OsmY